MKAFKAIALTYLFWSIFWGLTLLSDATPGKLILTVFPPYGVIVALALFRSTALPILVAAIVATVAVRRFRGRASNEELPIVANAAFLLAFVIASQIQLSALVAFQAAKLKPDCISSTLFLTSLISLENTPAHTTAFKDGKVYQWSFQRSSFYLNEKALQPELRLRMCQSQSL